MIINPNDLNTTTLNNLIDAFVLRDGTDYGVIERSLEEKRERCRRLLLSGKAIIVYDEETQSCDIQPSLE